MKPIQSRLPWAVHPKRVVNKLGRDTANEATQIQAVYELQAFTQTFEAKCTGIGRHLACSKPPPTLRQCSLAGVIKIAVHFQIKAYLNPGLHQPL